MYIGVTGSRKGCTIEQLTKFVQLADAKFWPPSEFHHGDCVGVDATTAVAARTMGYALVGHPPDNDKHRAFMENDADWPARPYLERNKEIVCAVDMLYVLPDSHTETTRSGTWSTKRYAHKIGRAYTVIYPNGTTELGN